MKTFTKNDNGFICAGCGAQVMPLGYSSRDHCPKCLMSLHVDINPGDRANECGGKLIPISVQPDSKKGFVIIYVCEKCGGSARCRAANDDDTALLIRLTNVPAPSGEVKNNIKNHSDSIEDNEDKVNKKWPRKRK
ncbi:MAG: RNHCP domain-containing protein [Oscillospiraceae bacterium]|nr:RNHCP domain-containing protein [Oscillospiraceae bacterium]